MATALEKFALLFKDVPWVYIGLGIGTVFVGLICIVLLCKIVGLFCKVKDEPAPAKASGPAVQDKAQRQQIIAAACAACAEYMGRDVKGLRVVSFKKI